MSKSAQAETVYSVSIEGVPMVLDEMGLANEVVAQWLLGENQEALITANPEQVAKLRALLHVRDVEPARTGVYIDRYGKWFAVKDGTLSQSGHWVVPPDVLRSLIESDMDREMVQTMTPEFGVPSSREIDPVCGIVMRPGQEAADVNYQGRTYHFCSDECRKLFLSSPADYVTGKSSVA